MDKEQKSKYDYEWRKNNPEKIASYYKKKLQKNHLPERMKILRMRANKNYQRRKEKLKKKRDEIKKEVFDGISKQKIQYNLCRPSMVF